MWDFLLTKGEMDDLDNENGRQNAKKTLINFLRQNEINYADIIDSVQRGKDKDGKYDGKDKSLSNIFPNNDLICHILTNRKAKYLLFNTASTFGNHGIQIWRQRNHAEFGRIRLNDNVRSFDLFVRQCQELGLGIQIQIQCNNPNVRYDWTNLTSLSPLQGSNKVAFEMKIKNPLNNPESICDGFPQGSEKVVTVITGPSPSNLVNLGLIGNNIFEIWRSTNPGKTPEDFTRLVYQCFRKSNWKELYDMNCRSW